MDTAPELTERDIHFECRHCSNLLVIDRDGQGLELNCPHCGGRVVVPPYRGDPRKVGLTPAAPPVQTTPPAAGDSPAPGASVSAESARVPASTAGAASPAAVAPPSEPPPKRKEYDFTQIAEEVVRKREAELKQLLKENQSQRVEIQGYINQATIQIHRNQLKLRKLIERQMEFESEMSAIAKRLGKVAPAGNPQAGNPH